jgi:hypothetical protein
VDERAVLSEVREQGLLADGLIVGPLLAFEAVSRRFQIWEEVYSAALRKADSGDGSEWADELRIFWGKERHRGHALGCPLLARHVADASQSQSAIRKDRLKAREERQLSKGDKHVATGITGGSGGRVGSGRGRGKG